MFFLNRIMLTGFVAIATQLVTLRPLEKTLKQTTQCLLPSCRLNRMTFLSRVWEPREK